MFVIRPFDNYINKKNTYRFNTSWRIHAPIKQIWNELINYHKWPTWCGGLEKIEQIDRFDHLKKGNRIRSTWKGALPYSVTFDSTVNEFIPYSFLSFDVTGDLCGTGTCGFLFSKDITTIHFIWNVSPTKLWLKMSSPFARPVFIENHNHIMEQVVTGFEQRIGRSLEIILEG